MLENKEIPEQWLIGHLSQNTENPTRIYAHGWQVYSSHSSLQVRFLLAKRRDCPAKVLEKMWQSEYALYCKRLEKDTPIDTRLLIAIADNVNTPAHCLREALGCITHAPMVHLLACGNPNAPMDVAFAYIHSYKWAALFALAHHRNASEVVLRYLTSIPTDTHNGKDMNSELRHIARRRLGYSEDPDDETET